MTSKDKTTQANSCTRSPNFKGAGMKFSNAFFSRLRFALAAFLCLGLLACGGSGGGTSSPAALTTTTTTGTNNTVTVSSADAANVVGLSVNADGSQSLTVQNALATSLIAGKTLSILPGADARFPFGLAGKVSAVQNANGSSSVVLTPATIPDAYAKAASALSDASLSADNFIGVIAPSAVQAGANASRAALAKWQTGVSALNGGVILRSKSDADSLLNKALDTFIGGGGSINAGDIGLNLTVKLAEMGIEPSKLRRFGSGAEASFAVTGKLANLKLTQNHEWKTTFDIITGLKSMELKVTGDLQADVKLTGGVQASLGSFNQAWKEVEEASFSKLGLTGKLSGLEGKDKTGRYPIVGLVFSVPCPPTKPCTSTFGDSQTAIRNAKAGGVIVWVYLTANGTLSIDGEVGVRVADSAFTVGMSKPEGGELGAIHNVSRKNEGKVLEAPYATGAIELNSRLGVSLDADFFFGGIRLANVDATVGGQYNFKFNTPNGWSWGADNWGSDWYTSGVACLNTNMSGGIVFGAQAQFGVAVETSWKKVLGTGTYSTPPLAWQSPTEEEILIPGWHGIGGKTWYTAIAKQECYPKPVVTKVSAAVTAGLVRITVEGTNLPDDLALSILTPNACSGLNTASRSATSVVFTCTRVGSTTGFSYSLSSTTASNLDLSQVGTSLSYTPTQTPTIISVYSYGGVVVLPPAPPISLGVRPATPGGAIEVSQGGYTTDTTPTISGTVSAALTASQTLRVYDGSTILGTASVSGTTWSYTPSTALPLGSRSFSAKVSSVDGIEGAASNTWAVNVMGVTSISPSAAQVNVPTTFSVSGGGLPLTAVLALADSTCQTPTARAATGFSVVCTPLSTGDKIATVKTDTNDNSGQVIDASKIVKVSTTGAATGKLPHSGITSSQCYQAGSNTLVACSSAGATALNNQQDGHRAAIDAMSYSAVGSYPLTSCVKDNVTGLIWEGKEASGTRAGANTYTNYDSNYTGGTNINASTNSVGYMNYVNSIALCGYTDWRLPTADELQSIVDYSKPYPGLTVNTSYFPNTQGYWYWSSSPYVGNTLNAWGVGFDYGLVNYNSRYNYLTVRLVRASQ